jgi:HAD superfamily hydrolase (TIGR01549 family)
MHNNSRGGKKMKQNIELFQAILFDFDGVLAESMDIKTEAFGKLFEPFGKDVVEKVVTHHVKNGGISRYKKIKFYYSVFLNQEISDEKLNDLANQFSDIVVNRVIDSAWVEGVKDFLEKYYEKLDLYVVTGTPQKEIEKIIKERFMQKYFKKLFGSPLTKTEIAKIIIEENKYDSRKVLYIGDTFSDYRDAKNAGIQFIGRLTSDENTFPEDIEVFHNFNELI